MKKYLITGFKYIEKYLRDDMPQSSTRLCFILITATNCFVVLWLLIHKQPINWTGIAAFQGVATSGKIGGKIFENKNNINNQRVSTDKFD